MSSDNSYLERGKFIVPKDTIVTDDQQGILQSKMDELISRFKRLPRHQARALARIHNIPWEHVKTIRKMR